MVFFGWKEGVEGVEVDVPGIMFYGFCVSNVAHIMKSLAPTSVPRYGHCSLASSHAPCYTLMRSQVPR